MDAEVDAMIKSMKFANENTEGCTINDLTYPILKDMDVFLNNSHTYIAAIVDKVDFFEDWAQAVVASTGPAVAAIGLIFQMAPGCFANFSLSGTILRSIIQITKMISDLVAEINVMKGVGFEMVEAH